MAQTKILKLIENESKFREFNESLKSGLDDLQDVAIKHGWSAEIGRSDGPYYFYCECSDENCLERILLTLSEYTTIHKDRRYFVIIDGHETPNIEKIIEKRDGYSIVEKIKLPPENVDHLHSTDVSNV